MARINSRAKGKNGELELAHLLTEAGFPTRRGQQFSGGTESPDCVCPQLAGVHIECKRVESGSLYSWIEQATRDAGSKKTPVVMHRRSRKPWVAILPLSDYLELYKKAYPDVLSVESASQRAA